MTILVTAASASSAASSSTRCSPAAPARRRHRERARHLEARGCRGTRHPDPRARLRPPRHDRGRPRRCRHRAAHLGFRARLAPRRPPERDRRREGRRRHEARLHERAQGDHRRLRARRRPQGHRGGDRRIGRSRRDRAPQLVHRELRGGSRARRLDRRHRGIRGRRPRRQRHPRRLRRRRRRRAARRRPPRPGVRVRRGRRVGYSELAAAASEVVGRSVEYRGSRPRSTSPHSSRSGSTPGPRSSSPVSTTRSVAGCSATRTGRCRGSPGGRRRRWWRGCGPRCRCRSSRPPDLLMSGIAEVKMRDPRRMRQGGSRPLSRSAQGTTDRAGSAPVR